MSESALLPAYIQDGDYLKSQELAKILKVTTKTVQRWTDAGKLPQPLKVSVKSRLYRAGDVRQSLAKFTGTNTPAEAV